MRETDAACVLAFAGALPGFYAIRLEWNARRIWFIVLWVLLMALLSLVFSEPVRGPFAKLIHLHASDTFRVHAGLKMIYPLHKLKDGIDLSSAIRFPGKPIHLSIKRNWWSGWKCDLKLVFKGDRVITVIRDHKLSDPLPPGWDINFDDWAIEVVDRQGHALLQVIQDRDYNVHVNAIVMNAEAQALILKDGTFTVKSRDDLDANDFSTPLFQYPGYAHRGLRK